MRATVNYRALNTAVTRLRPFTLAAMMDGAVKITVSGGKLTLTGTDLESWAAVTLDASDTDKGVMCVSRAELADALRAVKPRIAGKDLTVELADVNKIDGRWTLGVVVNGRASVIGEARDAGDFPAWPAPATVATLARGTIGELGDALWSVALAAGTDDTIPMLTQLNLTTSSDASELILRATDRYRAHMGTWPSADGYAIGEPGVAIGRKPLDAALNLMRGLCDEDSDELTLTLTSGGIGVGGHAFTHLGTLMDAPGVRVYNTNYCDDYPKIGHLFPDATSTTVTVDTLAALEVWDEAATAAAAIKVDGKRHDGSVLVGMHADGLSIVSTPADLTPSWMGAYFSVPDDDGTPAPLNGPEIYARVNSAYFADTLRGPRSLTTTIGANSNLKPIIVSDAGGSFRGLVMPMRHGGDQGWAQGDLQAIGLATETPATPRKAAAPKAPKGKPDAATAPKAGRPKSKPDKVTEAPPEAPKPTTRARRAGTPEAPTAPKPQRTMAQVKADAQAAKDKRAADVAERAEAARLRDIAAGDPDAPTKAPKKARTARDKAAAAFMGKDAERIAAKRAARGKA